MIEVGARGAGSSLLPGCLADGACVPLVDARAASLRPACLRLALLDGHDLTHKPRLLNERRVDTGPVQEKERTWQGLRQHFSTLWLLGGWHLRAVG